MGVMRGFLLSTRLFLAVALVIGLAGCMDASLVDNGTAPASITIQAVPPTLRDLGLRVSGPGMPPVAKSVPVGADALVLEVPVGPARRFELRARLNRVTTDQLNQNVWYDARRQVAVPPGGALVDLPLGIRSTILVPDINFSGTGTRLVAIEDLVGSDATITSEKWTELSFDDPARYQPSDVALDGRGGIYVAFRGTLGDGVIRVRDVGSFTPEVVRADGSVLGMAIDRERGRLFVSEMTDVYAMALNGSDERALNLTASLAPGPNGYFQGLAVDPAGNLYIAQSAQISHVDPETSAVLATRSVAPYDLSDVMVRPDGVYALVYSRDQKSAQADVAIVRFNFSLTKITGTYGTGLAPAENTPGSFFGPRRFLAETNREITIADTDGSTVARIVQIEDLSGTGWREYGQADGGANNGLAGEFEFVGYTWGGF